MSKHPAEGLALNKNSVSVVSEQPKREKIAISETPRMRNTVADVSVRRLSSVYIKLTNMPQKLKEN